MHLTTLKLQFTSQNWALGKQQKNTSSKGKIWLDNSKEYEVLQVSNLPSGLGFLTCKIKGLGLIKVIFKDSFKSNP